MVGEEAGGICSNNSVALTMCIFSYMLEYMANTGLRQISHANDAVLAQCTLGVKTHLSMHHCFVLAVPAPLARSHSNFFRNVAKHFRKCQSVMGAPHASHGNLFCGLLVLSQSSVFRGFALLSVPASPTHTSVLYSCTETQPVLALKCTCSSWKGRTVIAGYLTLPTSRCHV